MCRVLFSIGRFSIYSYGLMIALGVLLGYYWVKRRGTQCGIQEDFALDLALRLVLIGFLGGKILYVFTNWQNFLHEPLQYLGSSGFVVYGGILAGLAAAWSYCRRREVAFSAALDVFLPPVALAQAFGRVGCFLTGCCYGRPTQSRIGVVFPEGCSAPAGVPLIPTQLFSAAGDLLIVCLLLVYERRKAAYRTLAPTYFFLYGTGRFCIEFLRDDPRGSVGALSTSQFISVFVVILSAVLYWWEGRKHQKLQAIHNADDERITMAKCREKDEPYLFREKEKAPFSQLFFLSRLSYKCALLLIIFAITTEPILRYLTKLLCWIEKKDMKC